MPGMPGMPRLHRLKGLKGLQLRGFRLWRPKDPKADAALSQTGAKKWIVSHRCPFPHRLVDWAFWFFQKDIIVPSLPVLL
mmetsp:Transcript_16977/g.37558  ORF Transcript_16977/g.37558 Transcript_16977/m.37558 type:complete len:80 (+) Transcript_16977:1-240(+)